MLSSREGAVQLSTAGDVEIHIVRDGTVFILDLSRYFPAESPAAFPGATTGDIFCRYDGRYTYRMKG